MLGELWEFARCAESLRRLDEYEAFFPEKPRQSLFTRRRVRVHLEDGIFTAWAYLLARRPNAGIVISEGDWRAYRRKLKGAWISKK